MQFAAGRQVIQQRKFRRALQAKKAQRSVTAQALVSRFQALLDALTPTQVASLHGEFMRHADTVPNLLTAKELRPFLEALGDAPTKDELETLITMADAEGNRLLDFEEACSIVALRSQHQHTAADLIAAFRLFDEEGNGKVSARHFRRAMRLAQQPNDVIDEMIAVATGRRIGAVRLRRMKADALERSMALSKGTTSGAKASMPELPRFGATATSADVSRSTIPPGTAGRVRAGAGAGAGADVGVDAGVDADAGAAKGGTHDDRPPWDSHEGDGDRSSAGVSVSRGEAGMKASAGAGARDEEMIREASHDEAGDEGTVGGLDDRFIPGEEDEEDMKGSELDDQVAYLDFIDLMMGV